MGHFLFQKPTTKKGMKLYREEHGVVDDVMGRIRRGFLALAIEAESVVSDMKRSEFSGESIKEGVESMLQETFR